MMLSWLSEKRVTHSSQRMKELKRTQRAAFIVAKTTAKDQQPLEKLNINVHAAKYYAAKDHRKHMIPPTQRGPQI